MKTTKRFLSALLAAVLCVGVLPMGSVADLAEAVTQLFGDVNEDGEVTAADLQRLWQADNGGAALEEEPGIDEDGLYDVLMGNDETHIHTYTSSIVSPTCTTDGYTVYTCSGCDDGYVDDWVECAGHTWGDWSVTSPATCYGSGLQTRQCTVCGQSETSAVTQLKHDYIEDGTCVEDGITYTVFRCVNCGHTEMVKDSEEPNTATQDFVYDCDTDFAFTVIFGGSESELRERLTVVETQAEGTQYDAAGLAQVSYTLTKSDHNAWLVKSGTSYENGVRYAARLADDSVSFADYRGNRLNFTIKRRDDQTVIRFKDDILYLKALEQEDPGYYPCETAEPLENGTVTVTVGKVGCLKVGDLLCVGDYLNSSEIIAENAGADTYYIGKISAILPEHEVFVLVLEAPEINDVYDELDVALSIDWDRMDEVMDEEAQAELDNAVLSAMLEDDEFAAYLAGVELAAEDYLAERGLTPDYSFSKDFKIGDHFEIKCSAKLMNEEQYAKSQYYDYGLLGLGSYTNYKNKNTVIIVADAEITAKFPFKTESGNLDGDLTVKTNVTYTSITVLEAKYGDGKYSAGILYAYLNGDMTNKITFELGVHCGLHYTAEKEETPFVMNENTGTYHCEYCRIVAKNESTSSFKKMKAGEMAAVVQENYDNLDSKMFCGVCKPQMAILSDYLFVNTNTDVLHIASCYHVNKNATPIKGMASVLDTQGYECCKDCKPQEKQGEYLAEQISIKMSAGGMEDELEEMKEFLKGIAQGAGTSVSEKSDKKHLVALELPVAGIVGIYVQFDFVFDFDFEGQVTYTFEGITQTEYDAEYTCTHIDGFDFETAEFHLNQCEQTRNEVTKSDLIFEGTINTRIGGQIGFGVYLGNSKALSFGLHAGAGLYADLNGYLKSDFLKKDWYGGARFEAGLYGEAGLEGRLIWGDWDYPLVDWTKTKKPLLNYGYDEVWTTFVTTPESAAVENLPTASMSHNIQYREAYSLPADTFLQINIYDLKKMESGTKTLKFAGSDVYSVQVTENSGYFDVKDGVIYIAKDAPEEFVETITIAVNTTSSWKKYKSGAAVSYLESYPVSIHYGSDFVITHCSTPITPGSSVEMYNGAGHQTWTVTANKSWEITCFPEWCTPDVLSGEAKPTDVKFTISGFTDSSRSGTVTFTTEDGQTYSVTVFQKASTVTGKVTDVDGNAVSGASVTLSCRAINYTKTVTTINGEYTCKLPEGMYDVTVTADGYETKTATGWFFIVKSDVKAKPIALEKKADYNVTGIVVDAETGEPLEGVAVGFSSIAETETGKDGSYYLNASTPSSKWTFEEYSKNHTPVFFTKEGYDPYCLPVNVSYGEVIVQETVKMVKANVNTNGWIETTVNARGKCGDSIDWVYYETYFDEKGELFNNIVIVNGQGATWNGMFHLWDDLQNFIYQISENHYSYDFVIDIKEGITEIGYDFSSSQEVDKIILPASLNNIANGAIHVRTSINVAENNTNFVSCDEVLYSKDMTKLISCPVAYRFWEGVRSFTVPDSVNIIGSYAFMSSHLQSITLPKGVTELGKGAFSEADIVTMELPDSIRQVNAWVFFGCRDLKYIKLSVPLTYVSGTKHQMLDYCTSLESIMIPEAWNSLTIRGCTNLKNIYYTGKAPTFKTNYDIFEGAHKDLTLYYVEGAEGWTSPIWIGPDGVTVYKTATYDPETLDLWAKRGTCGDNLTWTLDESGTLTISGTGPMWDYNAVGYGTPPPWTDYNAQIHSLVIDEGVTRIGAYAFYSYSPYTPVVIQFENQLELPESLIEIADHAFDSATFSGSLILPDNITYIGEYAFSGCTTFDGTLQLPKKLKTIGTGAFHACNNFTGSMTIPPSLSEISYAAFDECGFEQIYVEEGVTSIGEWAFCDCTNLKKVEIADSVTEIGAGSFQGCISLQELHLPNNLTHIPQQLCYGCTALQDITIPASVSVMDSWTFHGCSSLRRAYFYGNAPTEFYNDAFTECASDFKIAYVAGKSGWTSPTWTAPDGMVYNTVTFTP